MMIHKFKHDFMTCVGVKEKKYPFTTWQPYEIDGDYFIIQKCARGVDITSTMRMPQKEFMKRFDLVMET